MDKHFEIRCNTSQSRKEIIMNPCKQIRKPSGITLLGLAVWCSLALTLWPVSAAQDLEDLEDEVAAFQELAKEIYRFDEEAMYQIGEAYCGRLDEDSEKYDKDFATQIGLDFQHRQKDQWEDAIGQVSQLMEELKPFQNNPETKDRADALLDIIMKEEGTLRQLQDKVVLQGANHPFVQYAINYGVEMHLELCDREGEEPKICDKTWSTLDGRPDLVYVDDGGLWILEFKPDNKDAISEGESQVVGYVEGVEDYFQDYFPEGQDGGYTDDDVPDSDHGGEEILEKLLETDDAWSNDGEKIIAKYSVATYDKCEEPD
jgi:hypothetical protein